MIDFEGTVGGKPFEGGKGEDMSVELGSGQLIPGFEDGLVGAKAGDKREVKVTFPADYRRTNLKGKAAAFAVTVKAVKTAGESQGRRGIRQVARPQSLDQLRGLIRDQQQQELNGLTRTHMKRQLLDQLAARHDFRCRESMVDAEYQNIMHQLRHEASHEEDPKAALAEIEKDAAEYRGIAERRVRLGLLLSEIGQANGVEVSEQEMNRLIAQAASQYQGKDRERFIQYIQQEPMAAAQLRAPLYEDKVVDFLFARRKSANAPRAAPSSKPTSKARRATSTGPAAAMTMPRPAEAEAKGKSARPRRSPGQGPGRSRRQARRSQAGQEPAPAKKPAAKAPSKAARKEGAPGKEEIIAIPLNCGALLVSSLSKDRASTKLRGRRDGGTWPATITAHRRAAPLLQRGSGHRRDGRRASAPRCPAGRSTSTTTTAATARGRSRRRAARWCGPSASKAKAMSSAGCSPTSMPTST